MWLFRMGNGIAIIKGDTLLPFESTGINKTNFDLDPSIHWSIHSSIYIYCSDVDSIREVERQTRAASLRSNQTLSTCI